MTLQLQGMIMQEKFLITVDDFHRNISRTFSSLRKEEDFFDVTLVSDDGVHILAHKVVLSASSEFFQASFKKADHPKPMLFFSGIPSNLLTSIVDFIYNGEVEILKENLKPFFDVAERFKMDGIPKLNDDDFPIENESNADPNLTSCSTLKFNVDPSQLLVKEELIKDEFDFEASQYNTSMDSKDTIHTNSHEEALKVIQEWVVDTDGVWMCKKCEKVCPDKQKLKKHFETHVRGLSYKCGICAQSFRSRTILSSHKQRKH